MWPSQQNSEYDDQHRSDRFILSAQSCESAVANEKHQLIMGLQQNCPDRFRQQRVIL